jgi:glycosidase
LLLFLRHTICCVIAIATVFVLPRQLLAAHPSPADWRNEVIYQVISDRFEDGDPSNNSLGTTYSPATGDRTHGGDFRGLTRRLGYLRGLGVTALWISPVVRNANGEYHGYAADDFTTMAAHWGSVTDAQDFVTSAHARDIRVILDVVCNHGGDLINNNSWIAPPAQHTLSYRNAAKQHAAPFAALSNWHAQGGIPSWTDPEQILGELFGLDDLRTEDAGIRAQLASIYSNWITLLDLDGFRIDTVKHVELDFWQVWTPAVRANATVSGKSNFLMFGEIFDGSEFNCGKYTGTQAGGAFALDSVLDYPLYFATNGVFAWSSNGAQDIANHYAALPAYYDPAAQQRLVTFLDNHDNPRFLSSGLANGATARLRGGLVFQLTSLGVPCIYYGTEQGFDGGSDPNCREDMFDGQWEFGPSLGNNFDQTAPLYRLVRRLNQFRRELAPLRLGSLVVREVHTTPGIFAYSRQHAGQEVLVAVNTSDFDDTGAAWATSFAPGTVLKDLLDPLRTVTVGVGGTIAAGTPLAANGGAVLVPQASVPNTEPEVVSASIPLGSTVSTNTTPLVLIFSEPMSKAGVEAAFGVSPATTCSLSWNGPGDVLTITPLPGWPGSQPMRVLVGESATDGAGAPLRGGFEWEFTAAYQPPPGEAGIDGMIDGDPRWGAAVATQTVRTGFGDNTAGTPDGNTGGSEADQLFVAHDAANLFVAVSGNLEPNGNAINLMFDLDSASGGVTTLGGVGASSAFLGGSPSASGTQMPPCMTCDLILQVQLVGPGQQLRLNAFKWNPAGQLVFEGLVGSLPATAGQATKGAITGSILGTPYTFRAAYDNRHTGPVAAGSATASPNGAGARTGLEIMIPKALTGQGPWYGLLVGISGNTGYWSNQFLPPIPPRSNLAWAPNLGSVGASCVSFAVPVEVSAFGLE